MKTCFTSIAVCAALAFMATVGLLQEAQGQQTVIASPEAIAAAPAAQYRVIDIGRVAVLKGRCPAETLEIILNAQAGEGWRVVTTSGAFIILTR